MKKLVMSFAAIAMVSFAYAQSGILKRIGNRAERKVEQKAGDKVEKAIDESVDGTKKKSGTETTTEEKKESRSNSSTTSSSDKSQEPLKTYSKYDFIPGEKVVAYEDFSRVSIGDFPENWNTNATGEVVTINTKEGKWFQLKKEGVFHPELITDLPENFTLEFDLGVNNGWSATPFVLNIVNLKKPSDYTHYYHNVAWQGIHAVHLEFKPAIYGVVAGHSRILAAKEGNYTVNNTVDFKSWDNSKNTFAHVSLWRQKNRLRVYLNGEKIWDIPKAFDPESKYNAITFALQNSYHEADAFLLNNIRLAIGAPDTRNKLITEGRFSTVGILFDVNSDKIKAGSYGTLKEIANVLTENADVKVKIIGHTDGDGDDKANLELSKKRAAAVKKALSEEFGIDGGRMETDGLGEMKAVGDNKTSEGKAQNRRVEFVKLAN